MVAVELELCRRLRNPSVVEAIENKVLDNRKLLEVAAKNGWKYKDVDSTQDIIAESCKAATKIFDRNGINYREENIQFLIISQLIPKITNVGEKRRGMTDAINRTNFRALQLLNSIAEEAAGKPYLIIKLTEALSPKPQPLDLPGHIRYD